MSTYGATRNNTQSFYPPAKFESEQKDLLISQLKAENFELRQNDRDYQELAQHLKSLEHRYNVLHDEKLRNEVDYKGRVEHNNKVVATLRTEIDNLKSHLTDRQLEQQEIRAENVAFKEIADHRTADTQRLKNELQQVTENNRRLYEDKLKLEVESQAQRDEKKRIMQDTEVLNHTYENLVQRLQERERTINLISEEMEKLEVEVVHLRSENEDFSMDLKTKNENLRYTRMQYQEAQNFVSQFQIDLEEIHNQNERLKHECQAYQEKIQQDTSHIGVQNSQVMSLEQENKFLDKQLSDLKSEFQGLRKTHQEALEQLDYVTRQEETFHRNFEILSQQNQELIEEVDRFHQQEDQQATARLGQLKELKAKLHQGIKQTNSDFLYQTSPMARSSFKQKNRFN